MMQAGRPLRVLVALDEHGRNDAPRHDLIGVLRARGFDVRHAASAEDAWRMACRDTVDVLVAQLASTDSRNLSLLGRARRSLAPLPGLLALAASSDVERHARRAGAHVTLRAGIASELVADTAHRLGVPLTRRAL